jgi:hypothetical protein
MSLTRYESGRVLRKTPGLPTSRRNSKNDQGTQNILGHDIAKNIPKYPRP